jgi:hypothetical protein
MVSDGIYALLAFRIVNRGCNQMSQIEMWVCVWIIAFALHHEVRSRSSLCMVSVGYS